ncbi:DNA-binding protein [Planococcus dechangensis]|uniref:DNA-binding protein n=1 Tax=Planococcus dechangensis TaxID=1176255 RepID=A0ABV9MB68_9BACL
MLVTLTVEDLRQVIRDEVRSEVHAAIKQMAPREELPRFLTREETKTLLRVSETKMSELLGRTDFPVSREFGVRINTDELFKWIEANTPALQKKRRTLSVI